MINYERINFFNYFKNNGYVKRIICLYSDIEIDSDGVYFNDRNKTEIPCVDKEIFIISNHDHEKDLDTYTLVQTDFTLSEKFKIIMIKDSKDCSVKFTNSKYEIYNFIRKNNLVEIKNKPEIKNPQIDFGYGSVIIEILGSLRNENKENKAYNKNEFYNLILENVKLSNEYKKNADSIEDERTMFVRIKNRALMYINIIFNGYKKDIITINEAFNIGEKYQENYYYNI